MKKRTRGSHKNEKNKLKRVLFIAITTVLIIAGGIMLWIGLNKFYDDYVAKRFYEKIDELMEADIASTLKPVQKDEEYVPPNELLRLMEENEDVVGYLIIDDTKISYPIVQAPKEEVNDYYLHLNLKKTYSYSGTIFLDKNQDILEGCLHSIYGHNMKNGTMFGTLSKFDDSEYLSSHSKGTIYTKNERIDLEILEFIEAPESTNMMTNVKSEEKAATIINQVLGRSYEPGNYYVLTTCMYQEKNDRGFLITRRTN